MAKEQFTIYLEHIDKEKISKICKYMHFKHDIPDKLSYVGGILLKKGIDQFLNENNLDLEKINEFVKSKKTKDEI